MPMFIVANNSQLATKEIWLSHKVIAKITVTDFILLDRKD